MNFFAFLLQLCGSAFLGIGIWLHMSYQGYATLYPQHLGLSADALFITIGSLSLLISFFGCCGSWFENRCCLVIVRREFNWVLSLWTWEKILFWGRILFRERKFSFFDCGNSLLRESIHFSERKSSFWERKFFIWERTLHRWRKILILRENST